MNVTTLPLRTFECDLDPRDEANAVPLSSYIVAKRVAQEWLAMATACDRQQPFSILDLGATEGEFSEIILDHVKSNQKLAVWVDAEANPMNEGIDRVNGAFPVEVCVGNVTDVVAISQISNRKFDRITVGLLHHFIGDEEYRHLMNQMISTYLALDGLILVVELVAGLDPQITRDRVLPHLEASFPDGVTFVADTPQLLQVSVRNTTINRTSSLEYLCAAFY